VGKALQKHLIIFTRLPCPGRNKTRLIPALGAEGAAKFHDRLARHTFGLASAFCRKDAELKLIVRLDGGTPEEGRDWLGECDIREQGGGDLGERLDRAVNESFLEGAQQVVIIGTDCPELDERILEDAFEALQTHPVVFGPACDGGYYLIGLSAPCPAVFQSIAWGGPEVLRQSLAASPGAHLLETLPDVDLPEDLPAAMNVLGHDLEPSSTEQFFRSPNYQFPKP